ncbi:probable disease resistance protein At5g66910 [Rosa rugosa]|uniref:probable disease resistance protein At5g66910 n=1 Tax=Rosa rugosa TaxID=74645 RepID=UPI002B404B66|nr:probable disease resistance protein At5g66910 [Rosa rugosa]
MWGSYKKYKYSCQLLELQSSLQTLQFILQGQQARDVKETLVVAKTVETALQRVDENVAVLKEEGITALKESLDEVRNIGAMVQRIDKKCEVRDQIDCEVPEPPLDTVGLCAPLTELKIKLLKNNNVSMLVLTAPGGCGKTTLATKFCQDEEVKDIFKDNIFFVTVTKKSTFNLIVQGLHQRKSIDVPMFQDEVTAVKWLRKFLMEEGQNLVLLVLDDVWSESKYILEKFDEVKMPNFKILVTSRSQFPEYGSIYHLKSLNDTDSMTLFRHSASLGDGQRNSLAREIIAPCKGYPLAIKVVGKSLRRKPIVFWRKRAWEWSRGDSIIDSETEVLRCLKSSLDALDEKEVVIKECFLDLGSFPQDQRIPAAALIDMWAELYKELDKDFLAIAKIYELTTRSLADLVVTRKETVEDDETLEDDDYYSEHFVTQHDMLRQLAVYQAKLDPSKKRLIIGNRGDNLPKCLTEQKHQPIKPRLLSISSDETFSTNLHNIQLADVEVLVLNFNTKSYALPEFVEKMVNLKVLIVTNHGFIPAELSNFHLLDSLPNLKRIRLERVSIPSNPNAFNTEDAVAEAVEAEAAEPALNMAGQEPLPPAPQVTEAGGLGNLPEPMPEAAPVAEPPELKSLKKISLFMCSIGEAFSNCSFQISNALPNLEELNIDYCKDLVKLSDELCNLVSLKKLSITNCHKLSALPQEIGKLEKVEVLRLRSCTELVKLPCSVKDLKRLDFLDISDCFGIVELPKDFGGMSSLRKINMRQCSRLKELPLSILFLQKLDEVRCDEDTAGLWGPFLSGLCNVVVRAVKEEFTLDCL